MFRKDMGELVDEVVGAIADSIDDYHSFILKYGDSYYDLEPVLILLSLITSRDDVMACKGIMSSATRIHQLAIENAEGLLETGVLGPLIGEVVDRIYDPSMVFENIQRVIDISDIYEIYNESFLMYNLYDSIESFCKEPVVFNLKDDSISFTEIYHAAAEIKGKCGNLNHLELTYYIWMLFVACDTFDEKSKSEVNVNFEGISDFMEFARIVLSHYFVSISEGLPIELNISENLYKDIEDAVGEEYIDILDNILERSEDEDDFYYDYLEGSYEWEFEEEQKLALYTELNTNIVKNTLMSICCKLFSMSNNEYVSALEKIHTAELKKLNKQIDKNQKTYNKDVKRKEEMVDRLNKEITKLKTKSKSDYYEKEISVLQDKLKAMEGKYEKATIRVKNLEKKLEEHDNLNSGESHIFNNEEDCGCAEVAVSVCDDVEEGITYEDKISILQDKTFAVIGGNPNFFKKFKETLPNSKHIDTMNESCNFTLSNSTDCIVNITKYTTHGHLQRAKSQVSSSVPVVNVSTYKLEEIIDDIYKELL